jgi:hypothetical protein
VDVHNKVHSRRLQQPWHARGVRYTVGTGARRLVDKQYAVP